MLMVCPDLWANRASPTTASALNWVQSTDGQTDSAHGCDVPALLPRDDEVVLVLPALALSWHRVVLPKINSARLRQALDGLLEDRLLADPSSLHLALQPGLTPGQSGWVAVCDKGTLNGWLALLQAADRPVTRITPELWPQSQPNWQAMIQNNQPWLALAHPSGVVTLPLHPDGDPAASNRNIAEIAAMVMGETTPRRSEPACVALAETTLGSAFAVEPASQRLLRSGQSDWNLAQFDLRLSAGARRSQRLGQALRNVLHAPAWRPARWGALALTTSALVGLNLLAWQEQRSLQVKQQMVRQLLIQQFPAVTLVIDAPLQMQREVAALQRASGGATRGDLEVLLQDMSASPHSPVDFSAIEFSGTEGRFKLSNPTDGGLDGLRQHLQQRGWTTRYNSPTLTVLLASVGSAGGKP